MACPAGEKKSLPSQFPGFNSIFIETNNIVNYLLKKERKVLINNIQAFSLKGSTCSCISPHKFITTVIGYRIVRESCLQSIWSLLITMALYFLKNVTLCIWLPPVSSKVSSPKFINKSNQRSISTTSSWAFVFLGQSVMCFFFFLRESLICCQFLLPVESVAVSLPRDSIEMISLSLAKLHLTNWHKHNICSKFLKITITFAVEIFL